MRNTGTSKIGLNMHENVWGVKGATLSDKSARTEFGITQVEIEKAVSAGQLQYRVQSIYDNQYLRLIRSEVEALVAKKHGSGYLGDQKARTKLRAVNREMTVIKKRLRELEVEKVELEEAQSKRGKTRH